MTGATTFKKGDIVTFSGANAVDPETKADRGFLQKFVVTADYAGGSAATLPISPAPPSAAQLRTLPLSRPTA
jgi:hypothetical protein